MCLITVIANNASISLREWLIKNRFINCYWLRMVILWGVRIKKQERDKNMISCMRIVLSLFEENSCPFHQRMLRNKFVWNWPCGSGEDFKMSVYFRCFVIISLREKQGVFHSRKLESPLHRDALCKVRLKLAQCFWGKRFLKVCQWFSLLHVCFYLPLENGVVLHLTKLGFPLPREAMCQVWLKLAKWFWRRNRKCEKFTKGLTDKGRTTSELKRFTSQKQPTYIAVWVNTNVFYKKKKTENKTGE